MIIFTTNLNRECKQCNIERSLKRFYENKDKISNQQKLYYENREKLLPKQNNRYINYKELLRSYAELQNNFETMEQKSHTLQIENGEKL